ncbi:MAG TPA: serine/threonine-protein kinase [Polyangiaceae bacterium]|nr:serine/threonine-protein kinase [Polyangiaceae bacterium]
MFVPISNTVVAGRYELIDEIGRGGMGVVWRARQANLGVECAIKFIHAAHAHDPDIRRRFVREARAAASLKSANSVLILDVDEWQGTLFIAMELLGGESLAARLGRDRCLSPRLTLEIIEQVARGLNKAHAVQLVHRDLKPDNIFIVEDDPLLVKILDFGIAKRMDAASGPQTTSGVLVGTPGYMSPEQADGGKDVDFRSDLWSLAVVAFHCLTGVAPFDADGVGQVLVNVMTAPIPAPRQFRSSLPAAVDEWWFRVLQREPARRPASATALASGLREALIGKEHDTPRALDAERSRPSLADSSPKSLQPTLQPVSSRPALRSRPVRRYAGVGLASLALSGWVLARQWEASSSNDERAQPAAEPPPPGGAARGVSSAKPAAQRPVLVATEPIAVSSVAVSSGVDAMKESPPPAVAPAAASMAASAPAARAGLVAPRGTSAARPTRRSPSAARTARAAPRPKPRATPSPAPSSSAPAAEPQPPPEPAATTTADPRLGF